MVPTGVVALDPGKSRSTVAIGVPSLSMPPTMSTEPSASAVVVLYPRRSPSGMSAETWPAFPS